MPAGDPETQSSRAGGVLCTSEEMACNWIPRLYLYSAKSKRPSSPCKCGKTRVFNDFLHENVKIQTRVRVLEVGYVT